MKIVLVGGHLSPALSVLDALPKEKEVLFIGRKYSFEGDKALSLEYRTIIERNISFADLNTGRLQRKLTAHSIPSLLKLPFGFIKAFIALLKFQPDIVVSFGGYISLPVGISACLLKIPLLIHEQTLEAGLANKILSKFATKICISWNSSIKYFPKKKIVFTGNPIRKFKISNLKFKIESGLPTIYITGGSSGSHALNILIEGCIRGLLKKYNVIHQTGDAKEFNDFDRLKKLRDILPAKIRERYVIKKFIDPSETGLILKGSSMIISRSGMNTITELIYFEKPAVLIPLPFSQRNEQLKNAKFLEKLGLGKVLIQKDLDSQKLLQTIDLMIYDLGSYKIDKNESKNLQIKNAAGNIIKVINYVYKTKKSKAA